MTEPTKTQADHFVQGYGLMKTRWLGDPGFHTGYELVMQPGRRAEKVRLVVDVVLGEKLDPAFQLRSVEGTADPALITAMIDGMNEIPISEQDDAACVRGRLRTDDVLLNVRLNALTAEIAGCDDPVSMAGLIRGQAVLQKRIADLTILRNSVERWIKDPEGRSLDEAWAAGGGGATEVIRLGSTTAIPAFIEKAQRENLRAIHADPGAPATRLASTAVGGMNEIVDMAIEEARGQGVQRVHLVTAGSPVMVERGHRAFVLGLADAPVVSTAKIPDLVARGGIASGDLVVIDCPEPRTFYLDRVASALEDQGLDVPLIAFNRTFAVMARTDSLRGYVEGLMADAGHGPIEPASAPAR